MEGDPRVDELMRPVRAAIERHVKGRAAVTDIYNRAYEAIMNSMDVIDTSAKVAAKQIAESAKNLQRAEAAENEAADLRRLAEMKDDALASYDEFYGRAASLCGLPDDALPGSETDAIILTRLAEGR